MQKAEFVRQPDDCKTPGTVVLKDGVHFGYYARSSGAPFLLLYEKGSSRVSARIPFPESTAPGNFYSMKLKLAPDAYEYNFEDGGIIYTDPCARRIAGREEYGKIPDPSPHALRGALIDTEYDWGDDSPLRIPFDESILYQLHVRGFTEEAHSGVSKKGTFAALRKKIPYLKSLGINGIKLMPVYEFAEKTVPPLPDGLSLSEEDRDFGRQDIFDAAWVGTNFWGYGPGFYFAPKASYASGPKPDVELKDLVKAAHAAGIEVLLEFSFTDQTDIGLISSCLSYWAEAYHIDGFSVLGRDTLNTELAGLPLFKSCKLICSWYPDFVTAGNQKESGQRLAVSNNSFMNDCRRLLKGEGAMLDSFSYLLRRNPEAFAQINYMTDHDGFTLMDLVSYNQKYNEKNGENGYDGPEDNYSWNCGVEGPTGKREVTKLRLRQRKNAYAMLLFSEGVPMLLAGDECGNSQSGNNNPWCHDSEISWVLWSHTKDSRELTAFVREAIAYRKAHRILHMPQELCCADPRSTGFPDLSYHGERAWYREQNRSDLFMGCMYSERYAGGDGFLYLAWNFHWEVQQLALPVLPKGYAWYKVMDTFLEESFPETQHCLGNAHSFAVSPRSVVILEGRSVSDGPKK